MSEVEAKVEEKQGSEEQSPRKTVEIKLDGFPEFKGPTSTVITSFTPGDTINKWQSSAILVPHEGLRLMHQIFRDIVNCQDLSSSQWKLVVLAKLWHEWYWPVLHHHHHSEEAIYFPALKKRVEKMPERFTKDHKQIIDMGTNMTERLEKYALVNEWEALEKIPSDQKFVEEIQKDFDAFLVDLEDHLSEEERFTPDLLNEGKFTLQEHDVIIQQIIRDQGMHGNALGLPLMLYAMHSWAGVEDINSHMMPNIPGPVRYLYKNSWLPKWRVCVLGNHDAVKTNSKEKVVLRYTAGGCCGGCCSCCVLL